MVVNSVWLHLSATRLHGTLLPSCWTRGGGASMLTGHLSARFRVRVGLRFRVKGKQ